MIILSKKDGKKIFPGLSRGLSQGRFGGLERQIPGMTRLHRTSLPPSLALLAACDFLLLAACFALAASWTQASGVALYLFYQDGLLQILPTAALIQITLYWERMNERIAPFSLIFRQMLLALG